MSDVANKRFLEDVSMLPPPGARLTPGEKQALFERGIADQNGVLTAYGKELAAYATRPAPVSNPGAPVPVSPSVENKVLDILKSDKDIPVKDLPEYKANEEKSEDSDGKEESPVADSKPQICPNCDWNMRFKFDDVVTTEDKRNFLRHVLGDSQTRFIKTYEFCGGAFKVVFRSRLVSETEQVFAQLNSELSNEIIKNEVEFGLTLSKYQMAVSLHSIVAEEKTISFPELGTLTLSEQDRLQNVTPIKKLQDSIYAKLSDAKFNILMSGFKRFERLYVYLQARSLQPGFWNEMSGQA